MTVFKDIIAAVIVLSLVYQLGSVLLKNSKYHEVFKRVYGILIIIMIFTRLSSCKNTKLVITPKLGLPDTTNNNEIITQFQNNLSQKIENDLHNKFYVKCNVAVNTDLKRIIILIKGDFGSVYNEVKSYVIDKYCTAQDEVILTNETN